MGGEGSIASMITTLRNNKNLLRGRRKGFFRRELSYSEIRSYYKESELPIEKGKLNQAYLTKVRKQIQKDRRKELRLQIFITSISLLIIGFIVMVVVNLSFPSVEQNHNSPSKKLNDDYKDRSYNEMLILGLENLRNEKYFFAVGNFENVLQKNPNDLETEILYAEALCLLCLENEQFCEKAQNFLNQLVEKYPENKEIEFLRNKYFE